MTVHIDIGEPVPVTILFSFNLTFLPLNGIATSPPKSKMTKGKISRHGAAALSQDMAAAMKNTDATDITIKCDGREFRAHKFMLSSRSSVFAAMFSHKGTKESETGEVEVTDCNGDTMEMFLQYIYTGILPEETFEVTEKPGNVEGTFKVAERLLDIASKYDVKPLVDTCAEILATLLDEDTSIRIAILSDLYRIEGLKMDAMATIAAAKKPLKTMNGWKDLDKFHDLKADILDCKAT